jgi:hypothetical protein
MDRREDEQKRAARIIGEGIGERAESLQDKQMEVDDDGGEDYDSDDMFAIAIRKPGGSKRETKVDLLLSNVRLSLKLKKTVRHLLHLLWCLAQPSVLTRLQILKATTR